MFGYNPFVSILANTRNQRILDIIYDEDKYQVIVVDAAFKIAQQRKLSVILKLPFLFKPTTREVKIDYAHKPRIMILINTSNKQTKEGKFSFIKSVFSFIAEIIHFLKSLS